MRFWLGTDRAWFRRTGVPLFVSRRTLPRGPNPPKALGPWALDSGGFTELKLYGRWTVPAWQYASEVIDWTFRVGRLAWAACQDWMCEPLVINGGVAPDEPRPVGTGLSVAEHQRRTVANYLELRRLAPSVPWLPVLQGREEDDYLRCDDLYAAAGIDLRSLPLIGLGSVCRRQATAGAERLIRRLSADGFRLHAFGFKLRGLRRVADVLASADSMAWSFQARRERAKLPSCLHRGDCRHCLDYALDWRGRVLDTIDRAA